MLGHFCGVAQNETKKWYFGHYTALDFMTSPPTIITTSTMSTNEGCASIADASGNLLFYTDGVRVYDKTDHIMANSFVLVNNGSTTQSSFIAKQPGNATLYYVFTLGANGTGALYYSVVDMSLASGNGSVTVKNATLVTSNMSEKLTATRHCNGTDIWIVTHDNANSFLSYLLTSAGLNTTPVVSTYGPPFFLTDFGGQLKISSNGKKLGMAKDGNGSSFEIYDFNNSTGVVSNSLTISSPGVGTYGYGCEFSPDGTKFYGAREVGSNMALYQWDLCAGSPTAISASQYSISAPYEITGMQLAPNGKIYVATVTQQFLGVINSPNTYGSGCNFVYNGQSVVNGASNGQAASWHGLPGFINSYFLQLPAAGAFTYAISGCQTASFTPPPGVPGSSVSACTGAGFSVTSVMWDFGDPASGINNTSSLANPSHSFSALGTYTTQLILYYDCGGLTDTLKQAVVINQLCPSVNSLSITCASLGSATAAVLNGIGPFSYTWLPINQNSPVVSGLNPGTYSVLVHDAGTGISATVATVFTSPIPFTGNVNSSSSITCHGTATGTANITNIAGGSANQVYLWSNGINSYTSASPATLSAGLWTVVLTDALTGCNIHQTFLITEPPALTLLAAVTSPSACSGSSIVLTGTASGGIPGYTYSLTNGLSGNPVAVSEGSGGNYIYTLTASDAYSCPVSQTIAVSFISTPTITVSDVSICPLQTGTLNASGAASYTWSNGASGNTFTDNPPAGQQYTVTGEALGCSSGTIANIILMPVPVPTLVSNSPVCEADLLVLNAAGGSAYSWNGPNAFASFQQNPVINPVGLSANGVYNVTVTAANSCTAAASQTIVINPLPTLSIIPASSGICANTTSVTLSAVGTATLFDWQPVQNISSNTISSINAYPASTQIYTLTGSLNSCTVAATATVNVVPPPMPVISLSSGSTCAEAFNGSPNTITLTAGGASSYTISTPNDIYNSNSSGPVTNLNTLPPHLQGVSTATLYGSNGVCTLSTTVVFTIVPNPTVSVNNPTPVICAGESFTYTNAGADSYTWSSSTPGQTLYTTGNVAVANPAANAVFSVFGGSLGCNSPLQSTTITVNPLPIVTIQPDPAVMCLNSSITLTVSGTGTSYSWSPPYWLNTDQGTTVIADPVSQQNYTVISSLNSCTASAMVTVSVLPLPDLTITSSSQNVLCLNQTFTLQGNGGTNYSWQYPNHFTVSAQAVQVIPGNVSYSGNYTLTGTGSNGCSNTATLNMTIENNPSGYLQSNNLSGCVPLCGDYQFVASNFPQSEVTVTGWQINNEALPPQSLFHHCFTSPGDYLIKGNLISTHGCVNTITLTITAYPQPQADFSYLPEKPVENFDRVSFTPFNDPTITSFNWYFANNDPQNQSSSTNPDYLFETAGAYPVALIVRNQWGCRDSVVKVVTVESDFAVYVPNAFTPNADGKNELFYPVTRGVQLLSFMIFNRWGEKLFSTTDLASGWDGTYQGQSCKEDTYVWKLEVTGKNQEAKKLSGFVILYR